MNPKDIHKLVPEEFSTYTVAQLREELPYIWRRSIRGDIEDALYRLDGEEAAYVRRMQKVQIFPPRIQRYFSSLIDYSTPDIRMFMEDFGADVAEEFETEVLHINTSSENHITRGYISNAGLLIAGRYPIHLLAKAIETTPDRLVLETRKYVGSTALLQTGLFFTEIIPEVGDTAGATMKTGITTKLTKAGEELWTHIVCHHMEYDHTISM